MEPNAGQQQYNMVNNQQNPMMRPDMQTNWQVNGQQDAPMTSQKSSGHDIYGSNQSIHHPMHDAQITALENTINQLNTTIDASTVSHNNKTDMEDEFMIRKDFDSKKPSAALPNQSTSMEIDPYQTRRQLRRK